METVGRKAQKVVFCLAIPRAAYSDDSTHEPSREHENNAFPRVPPCEPVLFARIDLQNRASPLLASKVGHIVHTMTWNGAILVQEGLPIEIVSFVKERACPLQNSEDEGPLEWHGKEGDRQ